MEKMTEPNTDAQMALNFPAVISEGTTQSRQQYSVAHSILKCLLGVSQGLVTVMSTTDRRCTNSYFFNKVKW